MNVKKLLLLALLLIGLSVHCVWAQKNKVLFVGNSLTFVNDMPIIFQNISNALGDSTEVSMHAQGGVGFANHVQSEVLYSLFREGDWDYVVLQPGTGDSAGEAYGGASVSTTVSRVRMLLDSIYAYNSCAQVLFYEISNGVRGNISENISEYNHTMDIICENTLSFADSTLLPMAPVGESFRASWNQDSTLMLWGAYSDVHPNYKGSYMAACVFYASIFNKPSLGAVDINNLSVEEAAHFQKLADSVVLHHQDAWRLGRLHANDFLVVPQTVLSYAFTNLSRGYDSLSWDFGDGKTSEELYPIHTYADAQDYVVTLSTWKGTCAIVNQYNLGHLNLENYMTKLSVTLYPNPCKDILHIQLPEEMPLRYKVLNLFGKTLKEGSAKQINTSDIEAGVYLLQLSISNNTYYYKFIKAN